MEDNSKIKIGIVFFIAKWFEEVVLGKDETSKEFVNMLQKDSKRIIERLSKSGEVVETPLVTSIEKAREASKKLIVADVDCVIYCFLLWSEDEYLLVFRDLMKIKPSILWGYVPYRKAPSISNSMTLFRNSGIVGTFEGFGVIKRMGIDYFYVTGSIEDESTFRKINEILEAAKMYTELKNIKIGILPYRNDQMIVTYVDEFRLYSQIGPSVDYISVLQLKEASDAIPDKNIRDYIREIKSKFKIKYNINDDNIIKSARASLGLEKIIFDNNLDALALSDLNPELHRVLGLRPVLYPEKLAASNKVVGNEGDLGATTGMCILRRLTGNPVMFAEIFNIDIEDNSIVAGHAGPSNYLMADKDCVTITPDYELMNATTDIDGVWMEFIGKPGKVTILNFICKNDNFQLTALTGKSIGKELRLEGYPHYHVQLDSSLMDFLDSNAKNGTSHHWSIVQGDVKNHLSLLADMLGIEKVIL